MTADLNRRCFPAGDALECFRREARAAKESDRIHAVMKIDGISCMGTVGYFPNIGECSIGYCRYSHVVKMPDCRWNCRSPANKTIDDRYRIRITGREEKTSELQDKENRTTIDSVGWKQVSVDSIEGVMVIHLTTISQPDNPLSDFKEIFSKHSDKRRRTIASNPRRMKTVERYPPC